MEKRIVFKPLDGGVGIVIPAPECKYPLDRIAQKDVPDGLPFWFVSASGIPEDRTFREAWELDVHAMGEPHGIGNKAAFDAWYAAEISRLEDEKKADMDRIAAQEEEALRILREEQDAEIERMVAEFEAEMQALESIIKGEQE